MLPKQCLSLHPSNFVLDKKHERYDLGKVNLKLNGIRNVQST